jgi:hypothetical protein
MRRTAKLVKTGHTAPVFMIWRQCGCEAASGVADVPDRSEGLIEFDVPSPEPDIAPDDEWDLCLEELRCATVPVFDPVPMPCDEVEPLISPVADPPISPVVDGMPGCPMAPDPPFIPAGPDMPPPGDVPAEPDVD